MSTIRRVAVAVSLGLVVVLGPAVDRPQAGSFTYTLVVDELRDLGTLSGHVSSEAHAINEIGAIAGSSETSAGVRRGVFWPSPTAAPINLWHLGGGWSEAWGINDAGVVVGNTRATATEQSRAFRWTQANGMSDLGLVGITIWSSSPPVTSARAFDINNSNVIVGTLGNAYGTIGYYYGLGIELIPSCPDGVTSGKVYAINDDEFSTGNVFCAYGPSGVPFFASFSTTTLLPGNFSASDAGYGINASNVVVGSTSLSEPYMHAFRWSAATGYKDIHLPDDTTSNSVARGINDKGLIVGRKYSDTSNQAFVYTAGLKMKPLPGLCTFGSFTSASEAFAVNDAGSIVGKSKTCGGDYHATLWKVRVLVRGAIDGLP